MQEEKNPEKWQKLQVIFPTRPLGSPMQGQETITFSKMIID